MTMINATSRFNVVLSRPDSVVNEILCSQLSSVLPRQDSSIFSYGYVVVFTLYEC